MILTGLYESQQEVKEGFRYWKARVSQSPDDEAAIKALEDHRKALPKFFKRIRALEELQCALKLEAKDAARIDAWLKEESYEWNFENAVSNVPMYCATGYVGPDGNIVWEE